MTLVKRARQRGAFVVCVDPYRTPTARQADWHLMPRPGTDGALALGVMHVLIGEGRVDQDYIRRATLGFTALAQHVKQYDPERVAAITGLAAEDVVAFARRYGATRAAFIRVGHRALPPRQRRHDVPDHRVPARADRGLRASRGRRAARVQRRVRPLQRGARAAGPDAQRRRRG